MTIDYARIVPVVSESERDGTEADRDYGLVAAVLRRLSPGELPSLPEVWEIYWEDPFRPDSLIGRDRLLGSGTGQLILTWAPLVVSFIATEVMRGALVDSAKDGVRAAGRKVVSRIRNRAPEPVARSFDDADLRRIRQHAFDTAVRLGQQPESADLFADAVVGGLSADPPPSAPSA